MYQWVSERNPNFYKNGCYGYRKIKGSSSVSVHGSGRAFDVSLRNQAASTVAAMWWTVNTLVANYCNLNVQRIIFHGHIWDADDGVRVGPGAWRTFSGKAGNHNDHAHIEISPPACTTLTYQDILLVVAFGNQIGGNPKEPTGDPATGNGGSVIVGTPAVPTPAPVQVPPPPPVVTLPLTDVSGKWTPEQLVLSCPNGAAIPEEDRFVYIICGGKGGYLINKKTGVMCVAGLAKNYGDVGPGFEAFLPYGDGYYWIDAGGFTIGNAGPDTTDIRPLCKARAPAPYYALYSPRNGTIVSVHRDDTGNPNSCAFKAPLLSGVGPCCD